MGRLENIVERNKNPRKFSKNRFPLGIGVALFVFIIIVLMVFTDLDESPTSQEPATPAPAASDEKRIPGVLLYSDRPKAPRDAAAD